MALMRDNLPKRRVIVDGMPIEVTEESSPADIIAAAGRNPSTYALVMDDGRGGSQLVPVNRRIELKDGQRFESQLSGIGG